MAVSFTSGNDFIIPTENGQTYFGGAGNDTYILSESTIVANGTFVISDTEGANNIQLVGGLSVTSSVVYDNAVELTLSNGAKVQILGAASFGYNIGGNALGGVAGTDQTFTQFVQTTLGTTIPAAGAAPSEGGAVVVPGGTEEPTTPTFSVTAAAASVTEGDSATFTVTLSAAQSSATTVAYTLAGTGGAVLGTDTTTVADGTLTFAAGVVTQTVTVPVTADALVETGEGMTLTLSAPSTGTVLAATPSAAVAFADRPAPTFTLTTASTVLEGALATFTVTASRAVDADTAVTFTVVPGDTAAANTGTTNTNMADFAAGTFNPSVVTILAGQTTATFTVTAANDLLTEFAESYSVNASVAGVTAPLTATTSLLDGAGSFTLTTGSDSGSAFTGGIGNDTFNAFETTAVTWTVGDAIDGGEGTDTFNITQTAAVTNPVGATVTNIETAKVISGTTGNNLNTTAWTGLTSLNVTGVTAQTVTAAATTAVTVTGSTATGDTIVNGGSTVSVTTTGATDAGGTTATDGIVIGNTTAPTGAVTVKSTTLATAATVGTTINVNGGTTVGITQVGSNALNTTTTDGKVVVTGSASTTSVTVTADKAATASATVIGHVNGAVTVNDVNAASTTAAGKITDVTLNNFAAATIDSSALTTVNLTGTATSLGIGRGDLTAVPTDNTLGLNVNGLTMTGALTDSEAAADDGFKIVNITSSTTASTVGSLAMADATTLNIMGDAKFTSAAETLTSVTTINVTNTGGGVLGSTIGNSVLFTGGAGADGVSLGTTTKAITMGAGDDTVTTTTGLVGTGGSVSGGDGTDTIVMTGTIAAVADNDSTFNSKFTGFETLQLSAIAGETLVLAGINGVSNVNIAADSAGGVTLQSFKTGGTLNLLGAIGGAAVTVTVDNASFNSNDSMNLMLTNSTAGALDFTTGGASSVTAAGVETIAITTVDTGTVANVAATIDTVKLVATSAKTVTVAGNNGLTITNTGNAAITSFDASGVVANGTTDTAANLAVTFASANTSKTTAVNITGGEGNDTLTGFVSPDAIVGNAGVDTITGGQGVDTLTGGAGADIFVFDTAGTGTATTFTYAETAVVNVDAEQITFVADTDDNIDADATPNTGNVERLTVTYTLNGTQATTVAVDLTTVDVTSAGAIATAVKNTLDAVAGITATVAAGVVTATADSEGTLVIDSVNQTAGTFTWAGGVAPAIADSGSDVPDVDTYTIANGVNIGDVLTATINGTSFSHTALSTTDATELGLLKTVIDAGAGVTGGSYTTGVAGSVLTITATAAGTEAGGMGTSSASITAAGMDTAVTTTAGYGADTITDFNTGGADIIRIAAANNVAGSATAAPIATASVQISTGGKVTFAAADDTFAEMLAAVAADNTNVASNEVVFFESGSDTYVYIAGTDTTDATLDSLIKLSGVTGLTTMTEGATAGDFTIA